MHLKTTGVITSILILILSGCHIDQPLGLEDLNQVSGDISSVVLRYDPQTQDMVPEDAVLPNVLNLAELKGSNFNVFYRSDISDVLITDQGSLIWEMRSVSPEGLNFQKSGDQYVPTDYDTFLLTTIYHHFESAFTGFQQLFNRAQVSCPSCFRHMDIHIDPQLQGMLAAELPESDNAVYVATSDMFFVFPQLISTWVHAGMNESVIAHEVFHSLFDVLVTKHYPPMLIVDETRPGLESFVVLRSLNEGLADYFSFIITGNDNILFHSQGDILYTRDRRLDQNQPLPTNIFPFLKACGQDLLWNLKRGRLGPECEVFIATQLAPEGGDIAKLQYSMGTYIARSLVRVGERLKDHDRVAQQTLQFLANLNREIPEETDLTLIRVLGKIVRSQVGEDKKVFCDVFLEDYDEVAADIRAVSECQ